MSYFTKSELHKQFHQNFSLCETEITYRHVVCPQFYIDICIRENQW
jgi:hypothetical protein